MTAVEYLIDRIAEKSVIEKDRYYIPYNSGTIDITHIIEQAKEMEKQQIIDAFEEGSSDGYDGWGSTNKEKYYNETYVSKESDEPKEEPKLINNCPKCGLDLIIRENCTPICTDIDCRGIILSNETLREWASKKEPKQEPTSSQTEISDEEIEKAAEEKYPYNELRDGEFKGMLISAKKNAWVDAIKWYREQLKQKI